VTDDVTLVDPDAIPDELKERDQWLLWDNSNDTPKQPHWRGDFAISWSNPDDWHSFEAALSAAQERESWGIGYVMAQGNDAHARGLYACLDLDGCLESRSTPKDWVPTLKDFIDDGAYIEYSPSGDGLHIPLVGQDIPDWWVDSHLTAEEHEGVDVLTNKFCTFTGDVLDSHEPTGVADVDPTPFLYEVYERLNGEYPREDVEDDGGSYDDDEWDYEQIEVALDHLDSGCAYPKWRNIAFAVHDWDPGTTGKSLFEQWSRGSGWDEQSQRYIDQIWDNSAQGDGITVGTLIHYAQEAGWQPAGGEPDAATADGGAAAAPTAADSGERGDVDWDSIYAAYKAADKSDERRTPRFQAAAQLAADDDWANMEENDVLYWYNPAAGTYEPRGESVLRQQLVEKLNEQYSAHEANEIGEQLRGRFTVREDDMGGPEGKIAAENCVIDLIEETTYEHSPHYNFLSSLGTEFDPDATCPRWRAFLDEVVDSDTDRQKLQEFAGYCLHHWGLPYHKALFLVGPTASGKSTFLDTINALLGDGTTASLTPQQMTSERFGGAELHGKWANIRNDIPAETVNNTGMFKELIAGDPIKAEEKYKDPFMFRPNAKHMFSANQLPETDTDDEAFYRRILLCPFPETIPRAERDPALDDKLQSELPGILNWAIEGLQRLLGNGRFTGDRSPGHTQDTWEKWGNSVSRFSQVALEDGPDKLPKGEVYAAYLAFCREESIPTETQHAMTRALKKEGYTDAREYVDGSQQRVFTGIQWTGRGEELITAAQGDTSGDTSANGDTQNSGLGGFD